jgi:hypothetical protein
MSSKNPVFSSDRARRVRSLYINKSNGKRGATQTFGQRLLSRAIRHRRGAFDTEPGRHHQPTSVREGRKCYSGGRIQHLVGAAASVTLEVEGDMGVTDPFQRLGDSGRGVVREQLW